MTESYQLDQIDRQILAVLSKDGRLSNAELSERVGLSASPCWNRVRRLEKNGIICGYRAELDPAKLGVPEIAIVEVSLGKHDEKVLDDFGAAIAQIPEILEVYLMTGDYDYLLKVSVPDTRAFEQFLRKKLYALPGIRQSRTSFTLRCLKKNNSYIPGV